MDINPFHFPAHKVHGLYVLHAPASGPAGDARPPLLLVHGVQHGAWCWEFWLRALPRHGWSGYALSLRNHAGSDPLDEAAYLRLTLDDYVDDVCRVLEHIGRPCVLVGHSMGGLIVQAAAARYGSAGWPLPAAVLLASAAPAPWGGAFPKPIPTDRPHLPHRGYASSHFFYRVEPEVLEGALARLCPESPSVMNDFGLGEGYALDMAAVRCPLLVVTAEHDRTPVPRGRMLADLYGADYLFAAGQGHDLMLEIGWETVLDMIVAWLERRVAGHPHGATP